jgi:hypothetical protein
VIHDPLILFFLTLSTDHIGEDYYAGTPSLFGQIYFSAPYSRIASAYFGSYTVHYRICGEWAAKCTDFIYFFYFMWWLLHVSAIIMPSSGSS